MKRPSFPGGVVITIRSTPATFAGTIFISTEEGYTAFPPGTDSIAGPSEILVLADETANPRFVAADLLSQAEHDEMASAILVTTSEELARKVSRIADLRHNLKGILCHNFQNVIRFAEAEGLTAHANSVAVGKTAFDTKQGRPERSKEQRTRASSIGRIQI